MKVIREIDLSGSKLQLKVGKAFHSVSLNDNEKEYPTQEFTLQEVEKDFRKLLNANAENLSSTKSIMKGLGYVSQKVLMDDALRIKEYLESIGLEGLHSYRDFHFTLQFDKTNPVIEINEMARDKFLSSSAVGIELLAPDSPVPALAIVFKSPDLDKRFLELKKMGFTYDYDNYLAHVTIKYNPKKGDLELLEKHLKELVNVVGEVKCGYEAWRIAKT